MTESRDVGCKREEAGEGKERSSEAKLRSEFDFFFCGWRRRGRKGPLGGVSSCSRGSFEAVASPEHSASAHRHLCELSAPLEP